MLEFTKVEGLGNDFLLVEGGALALPALQAAAVRICDRRRGVGGDGLLLVGPPRTAGADATMWVVNHDGSRPEMCGNGLRCVALWAAAQTGRDTVVIDTDDGPKRCVLTEAPGPAEPGLTGEVTVAMGPARHGTTTTPRASDGRAFAAVSMGNPHAIAFVDAGEDPEALARTLGPGIETDPAYPQGTNVELAHVQADSTITLWVWERGCGITEACGTGACATAAAAVAQGRAAADTPIAVRLPGGTLTITVPSDRSADVTMRGPARLVYRGHVPL